MQIDRRASARLRPASAAGASCEVETGIGEVETGIRSGSFMSALFGPACNFLNPLHASWSTLQLHARIFLKIKMSLRAPSESALKSNRIVDVRGFGAPPTVVSGRVALEI